MATSHYRRRTGKSLAASVPQSLQRKLDRRNDQRAQARRADRPDSRMRKAEERRNEAMMEKVTRTGVHNRYGMQRGGSTAHLPHL